jgi:hypothetical protein
LRITVNFDISNKYRRETILRIAIPDSMGDPDAISPSLACRDCKSKL